MSNAYRMFVRPEGICGERGADLMESNGVVMAQEVVASLPEVRVAKVLEIGFGPGLVIQLLAQWAGIDHVTGLDPSAVMHRRASRRNAVSISEGRVELLRGEVEALPFEDQTFDVVLAVDNLHF